MNFQSGPPIPVPPNPPFVPHGWKAEWSVQYARYFYVNLTTNESVWVLPTVQQTSAQTAQAVVQRKPVPIPGSDPQATASGSPQQPSPGQYSASIQPALQQHSSQALNYQNFSPPPTPGALQQQYGYFPPNPQFTQPHQRNFTQAPGPASYNLQSCMPTPPIEERKPSYHTLPANPNAYFKPPPTATNNAHHSQHHNNSFSPPPPQQHASNPHQAQSYHPARPAPQSQRLSTFASLSSNKTLNKWSSKLGELQNKPSTAAPPATARSAPAAPTPAGSDWKKWTKRAAIGVAAVGALALGVDAIGDAGAAFGAGDFSSGGDFGGGASEALDASAAQIAMEQQGQENALMLLDPPGTTYTVVDANSLV